MQIVKQRKNLKKGTDRTNVKSIREGLREVIAEQISAIYGCSFSGQTASFSLHSDKGEAFFIECDKSDIARLQSAIDYLSKL